MPVTSPDNFEDKTLRFFELFARKRLEEFTPDVMGQLLDEYERDPTGSESRHSPNLQRLVNFIRSMDMDGKTFVHAKESFQDYRVGAMRGRGSAPDLDESVKYETELDGVREVFRRRLTSLGINPR